MQLLEMGRAASTRSFGWIIRALEVGALVVSAAAIALVLTPTGNWTKPSIDDRYHGFDSNLVYADAQGAGRTPGMLTMTQNSLQLQAVPFSDPTVQLITSPRSFSVAMGLRILDAQGAGVPLQLCLWNPVTGYRACLVFGPSPINSVE